MGLLVLAIVCSATSIATDTATFAAIEQAVGQYQLTRADALLAAVGADADSHYLRGRIALARYRHAAAGESLQHCRASARDGRQQARCLEIEAELLARKAAESNDLIEQVEAARAAQDLLASAADLDPENVRVRQQRARNYRLLPWYVGGSSSRADRNIEAAARARPELAASLRGVDAWYAGDDRRAISELAAALDAGTDADTSYYLAQAQARSGDAKAAIRTLQSLTASGAEHWEAWFALGSIAEGQKGQEAIARQALATFLRGAIDAVPKRRANALYLLGRIAEREDNGKGAIAAYRAALIARPGHNDSQAALTRLTGK